MPSRSPPMLSECRVGAAWMMLLTVSMAPGRAEADTTQVHIAATVLRHASVALRAPRTVMITVEDIARGYAVLAEPIEVAVRTNAREGLLLGFSLRSQEVGSVMLSGEAGDLHLTREGARLPVAKVAPGLASRTLRMAARLELKPGLLPGPIAFPVSLFVAPN